MLDDELLHLSLSRQDFLLFFVDGFRLGVRPCDQFDHLTPVLIDFFADLLAGVTEFRQSWFDSLPLFIGGSELLPEQAGTILCLIASLTCKECSGGKAGDERHVERQR